jgi:far upstream element-binding protein
LTLLSTATAKATIQQIQDQSGASIQVPRVPNEDNPAVRTIMITHPNEEGAALAKSLIENVLKSKPSFSSNPSPYQQQAPSSAVSVQVSIPDKDVGLCIGRGGCVIKHMQQVTNTRIQIPPSALPGESYRVATISGPPEGCSQVQQMIARIVAEQSSASIMSGAPFSGDYRMNQQPQGQNYAPQQNQQGYSAEWAAYHAAQAAASAAQQEQQQVAATTASTTAATTADYEEQFFRYAYYYGEAAARAYYGAWAPPEGTPNPYGVNPAGITAAPAAAETGEQTQQTVTSAVTTAVDTQSASTPVAATEPAPEARETSRRHVSNLPAWMTKK